MTGKVLITGSTGLIGTALKGYLVQCGYSIHELSRRKINGNNLFQWDIEQGKIDPQATNGVTTIVHLAGAGIADKRWSEKRKKELYNSRINSTRLLYETLKEGNHQVNTLVSASAIGYYGFDRGQELVNEESTPGEDFLADITMEWEKEATKFNQIGIRVVILRIGIVLSNMGGALPKISTPIKWMAGAPLGKGGQYMSWIHIEDMIQIFELAIRNTEMKGIYNAVAPFPETSWNFTKMLGREMGKPVFLPPVPGFVLKLLLGEMALMVLGGINVSAKKISDLGYSFNFSQLEPALENLIKNK